MREGVNNDTLFQLERQLNQVYQLLRNQQQEKRTADTEEAPLYAQRELVWLKSKRNKKGKTNNLQVKFAKPYKILVVNKNHTYVIEQNKRTSREAESRLKPYVPTSDTAGRAPALSEPNRQPTHTGFPKSRGDKNLSIGSNEITITDNLHRKMHSKTNAESEGNKHGGIGTEGTDMESTKSYA